MSGEPRLVLIPADQIDRCWPVLAGLVAAACARSHGTHEAEDIRAATRAGAMRLWAALGEIIEAVAITEIVAYPRCSKLNIVGSAGVKAARWVNLLDGIEAWGRAQGCVSSMTTGRPGWERHLGRRGYGRKRITIEKDL